MAETSTNDRVMSALRKAGLHPIRVENVACAGTPDVNYNDGWIENKQVKGWPVRPETPLRVDHFTPQQRVWHVQRRKAGGRSFVFVQIGRDYLLLDGKHAAQILGHADKATLLRVALGYWVGRLNEEEFIAELRRSF